MHANRCPVVREVLLKTSGNRVLADSATLVPVRIGTSTFAEVVSLVNDATVIDATMERNTRTVGYSFTMRIY